MIRSFYLKVENKKKKLVQIYWYQHCIMRKIVKTEELKKIKEAIERWSKFLEERMGRDERKEGKREGKEKDAQRKKR